MSTPRSTLALRDLLAEVAAAIVPRPARALLTALGTAAGVGTMVATIGLASTARAQVGERFDALAATEVRVTDAAPDGANPFPHDVDARLERLNGVEHAGIVWAVPHDQLDVRSRAAPESAAGDVAVMAASKGAVAAAHPRLATGVVFDAFHERRRERVAVLGRDAARQLGITRVDHQPVVFLGQAAYTVVGILADVERTPDLLLSVIVPARTAEEELPPPAGDRTVLVDVAPGAARLIARQAPLALRPDDPRRLTATAPPDPRDLRDAISQDLSGLLHGLAGLALLVGMIGIAQTTLVAVLERRSEIGLRRALGARQRHIAAQFLVESGALGALGGVVGTAFGVLVVVGVAAARGWTTTMSPLLVVAAPAIGAATGLLAGISPALRAARTEPTDALR